MAPRFIQANLVATVFKAAAVITLTLGTISSLAAGIALGHSGTDTPPAGEIAGTMVAALAATILVSCTLAFFGYVLDILIAIYDDLTEPPEAITEHHP